MNGCAIPYTPIAVDFWKTRQCPRVKFFFLTHAYVDQSCGLSHSWSMPIYCSPITRAILLSKFSIRPEVVHELELDVLHSISLSNDKEDCVKVTLIDSNYCPGSVMFFFEGYFGRILYTGNFRFNDVMVKQIPLNALLKNPVDVLYLDNTYCNLKCVFPTKESALQNIIGIIDNLRNKKILIALKSFGKEELLISLSSHFKEKIRVGEDRLKVLEVLKEDHNFTINNFLPTNIEVIPFYDIFHKVKHDMYSTESSICLVPTGLFTALGYNPFESQSNVFIVPYSNHSSYAELIKFVSLVHPKSIVPINKPISDPMSGALMDRTNIDCFHEFLEKSPMHHYHIPQSVLKVMNQSSAPKNKRLSKSTIKKYPRKRSEPALSSNRHFESCEEFKQFGFQKLAFPPKHLSVVNTESGFNESLPFQAPSNRRVSLTLPLSTRVLKRSKSLSSLTVIPNLCVRNEPCEPNTTNAKTTSSSLVANFNFYQLSNLVRCHRARLCIPDQCQTVCHSKNTSKCFCKVSPVEADSSGTTVERIDNISPELSKGLKSSLLIGTCSSVRHRKLANVSNLVTFMPNDGTNNHFEVVNSLGLHPINSDNHLSATCNSRNLTFSDRFVESSQCSFSAFKGENYEPAKKVMKQCEEKHNNELPPKKKWCNKFNTSQLNHETSPESSCKSKPVPLSRRRLGTTANPVDTCLNSIANVSATCQISDSGYRNISNIICPKPTMFLRPVSQIRCGPHLISGFHFNPRIATEDLLNFGQPTSPIDLSISKT